MVTLSSQMHDQASKYQTISFASQSKQRDEAGNLAQKNKDEKVVDTQPQRTKYSRPTPVKRPVLQKPITPPQA